MDNQKDIAKNKSLEEIKAELEENGFVQTQDVDYLKFTDGDGKVTMFGGGSLFVNRSNRKFERFCAELKESGK